MATRYDIKMPQLGLTMEEGTIVEWHKSEGDAVAQGELVVTIESEKTQDEVTSPVDGVVSEILVEQGATVKIGIVLARVSSKD